jgi:lipoate-protein ligase A
MTNLHFFDVKTYDGCLNMAFDEALALDMAKNRNWGYLRFYQWNPPTLSFGYNQRIERLLTEEALTRKDVGLVRRMSGGKMVFHDDELTFSMGLPAELISKDESLNQTFLQTFQALMTPLVNGMKNAGLPVRFSNSREQIRANRNMVHCYAAAAGHSVYLGDKKLIGAAGVFRDNCMIIHGAIPISISFPDKSLFVDAKDTSEGVDMACLGDCLSREEVVELPEIIAREFSKEFNLEIVDGYQDTSKMALVEFLVKEKYSDIDWKNRRAELREKLENFWRR